MEAGTGEFLYLHIGIPLGREGGREGENSPCGSRPPLVLLAVQSWSSSEEGVE